MKFRQKPAGQLVNLLEAAVRHQSLRFSDCSLTLRLLAMGLSGAALEFSLSLAALGVRLALDRALPLLFRVWHVLPHPGPVENTPIDLIAHHQMVAG